MPLVQMLLSTPTWRAHGKVWEERVAVAGMFGMVPDASLRLKSTLRYLVSLRVRGVSAGVAQRRLSGLHFHFLLCSWEDVAFFIRQALKAGVRSG